MASAGEPRRKPVSWPLLLFTAAYVAIAAPAAVLAGNNEFLFYIIVMLGLVALVGLIHLRVRFSSGVLWALSVWGLLHMAGGLMPVPEPLPIHGDIRVLYSMWIVPGFLKYDHVVHFYGFWVTTWACWQIMRAAIAALAGKPAENIRPRLDLLLMAAAAGMGFGAGNEVVEFIATLLVPETNVGGYENTGWDLVSNMLGCIAAGVAIRLTYRPR